MTPSEPLAAIVGHAPLTRSEAITLTVLKAKACQLFPSDAQVANPRASYDCDSILLALTGKSPISLFALCSCVIHNLR